MPDLSAPLYANSEKDGTANDFTPPEQAAQQDDIDDMIDLSDGEPDPDYKENPEPDERLSDPMDPDDEPKPPLKERLRTWWRARSKRQKIAIIVIAVLFVVASAVGVYALTKDAPAQPAAKPVAKAAPKVTTVASTLTGRQVNPKVNEKPVIAAMIENSQEARPQSGLYDAGVVFEAIAEGGITRFLAVYQDTDPESIGPVRSARPYYIDWLLGFDAAYAHVGGSPEALQLIRSLGVKDLDQSANAGAYQRVSNRASPHNVYTSAANLSQLAAGKGFTKSTYTGFARKKDAASKQPTAGNITINISSAKYNTTYTYDAKTNSYLRNLAGAAHTDEKAGKQINPKVVVAMVVPYSISGKYSIYGTLGTGQVYIFQDGVVTEGTWQKNERTQQIRFIDSGGRDIALNAGQTWIAAVKNSGEVSYQP